MKRSIFKRFSEMLLVSQRLQGTILTPLSTNENAMAIYGFKYFLDRITF